MVITNDVKLPEYSELEVEEVNLSQATLRSASPYLGKYCEAINNEFMLCRQELNDPRPCLSLGKQVTACTLEFFRKVKQECLNEFNQYANCIDKSSGNFVFSYCRNTQAVFDQCMKDNLGMERPHFGYFTRARVHATSRPKPPPQGPSFCPPQAEVTPRLPDCKPRERARFNGRQYWVTE